MLRLVVIADQLLHQSVNQVETTVSTNLNGHARKKTTARPKLHDEVQSVQSMVREEGLSMTQGGQGKRKAMGELDKDLPVPRYVVWLQILINTNGTSCFNIG